MIDEYILKQCIPSKESCQHQLHSVDLPDLFDPETGKYLGDPMTQEQLEFLESVVEMLPESYL